MDPLTILAGLKATHEAIKLAVKLGKDVTATAKDISSLMGDVAKLTQIAATPKGWKTKGSAEEQAIVAFTARKEAEDIQRQVQSQIVSVYGMAAWEGIVREVAKIKKAQQEEAVRIRNRNELILDYVLVFLIVVFAALFLGLIGYVAVTAHRS
jgi:hypothetical protein